MKTIFEWSDLFLDEIHYGASQSGVIQLLEDYKKEQPDVSVACDFCHNSKHYSEFYTICSDCKQSMP